MLNRTGRMADDRSVTSSRARPKVSSRLSVESLEGRALLTASLAAIAPVTVPQFMGYQLPLNGSGTTDPQTFTVTSDTPGVKASVASGQFWTIAVSHTSSGAGDPTINGSMTFQLFQDLTPQTTAKIESLITGTAPFSTLTTAGQTKIYPNGSGTTGQDFYTGLKLHRIASGFPGTSDYIVQGGSINGDGTGSAFANPFDDEFVQSIAFTGTGQLAMANSGSDTNDSQFFITTGSPRFLDYHHTIFGQIVSGTDVLNELTQVKTGTDGQTPVNPVTITSATLSSTNPNGVIHIDTTNAPIKTANLTVTATDTVDHTTATQNVQVNVQPIASNAQERPFLGPVNGTPTVGEGQTYTFQLTSVSVQPGDQLTYTVQGGTSTSTSNGTTSTVFTSVQNGTASVSSTGLVTVTPTAGYSGPINLIVGVRDQVNRQSSGVLDQPANYDTQPVVLTVNSSSTPVAIAPIAAPASLTGTLGTPISVQLQGSNPNTGETKPITYNITTQPTNGTITNFNASTGTLTYTPTAGYIGPDSFAYSVTDPNSNMTSFPATVKLSINQANTGAVRFLNDGNAANASAGVLIVTPPPRTDHGTNTIDVSQGNGTIIVAVNGVVDAMQPTVANTDRIIVYGSKSNDQVRIDNSLTMPVTLDGGHGGVNVLQGGGGPTTEHGWFGTNSARQGSSSNYQIGANGHITFYKNTQGTSDQLFKGRFLQYHGPSKARKLPKAATGTYYTFKGSKLVKAPSQATTQTILNQGPTK
jgi:cyclophilin family peptidyl-prolyl cis-trans isomerase/plastocyanin